MGTRALPEISGEAVILSTLLPGSEHQQISLDVASRTLQSHLLLILSWKEFQLKSNPPTKEPVQVHERPEQSSEAPPRHPPHKS